MLKNIVDLDADLRDVRSVRELASALGLTSYWQLVYWVYRRSEDGNYVEFDIPKRRGGSRRIATPATPLKLIQIRLNVLLQKLYEPRHSAFGFIKDKNIVMNARRHSKKYFVLSIDLKEFFPSINFGRIYGLLKSKPYELEPRVAAAIAKIATYKNALPQGAPTSPVLSNMVTSRLDYKLDHLCRNNGWIYTRYADDIVISTQKRKKWIGPILRKDPHDSLMLSEVLIDVIESEGFTINSDKVRGRFFFERQEVTGLVANEFANVPREYINRIKGALHVWSKVGESEFERHFSIRWKAPDLPAWRSPARSAVLNLRGRIQHVGSVKGWSHPVYVRLRDAFNELASDVIDIKPKPIGSIPIASVWVIEDETKAECTQGTGFFLDNGFFVTAAHNLLGKPYIYHPALLNGMKFDMRILGVNRETDLAVLIQNPFDMKIPVSGLKRRKQFLGLTHGSTARLLGYPNHAHGKTHTEKVLRVASLQNFASDVFPGRRYRHINFDGAIIEGASGSPVLDDEGFVVGVALRGATDEGKATATDRHSAIEITNLVSVFDLP